MENNSVFNISGVEKTDDDGECRYVTCDECDTHVDCYNDNINIVLIPLAEEWFRTNSII